MPESTSPQLAHHRVVVVIPALNEEGSIATVVRSVPHGCVHRVIVVDNGSVDATARLAADAGATVLHEPLRGYGHACMRGMDAAMSYDATIIVFMDGDMSDYPEELPGVVGPILYEGADLVIGSRVRGNREPGALLPQAVFGNWLSSMLIRLLWGYVFTDLGPFRAVTTEALSRMHMKETTYGWTVEMQIKAAKLGMKCIEVPVSYRQRQTGNSKVTGTMLGTVKASWKILSTIATHALARE